MSAEPSDWWEPEIRILVDPSLPEGVFMMQDRDGRWWRYPWAEYVTWPPETPAPDGGRP